MTEDMDSRLKENNREKSKISEEELKQLKIRLEINHEKQSKLTDAYLDNLLSEEMFKIKNEEMRKKEEELQKSIALQELREIERERSRDYINRVEEFLLAYNPECEELNPETQKQVLNLIFKNIKIARKDRKTKKDPSLKLRVNFFAPFSSFFKETSGISALGGNSFLLEQEKFFKCQQNQLVTPQIPLKSILKPMAVR